MLTDTHCHILSTEYYNPQSIIDNLSSSNIKRIIINGYNQISNEEVLKLINNQNVYGALGIHPDNISLNLDKELDYITQNINTKGIIAIGEIGLDYYHNDQNKEEQIKLLDYFLTLAENNNLPYVKSSNVVNSVLICFKAFSADVGIYAFNNIEEILNPSNRLYNTVPNLSFFVSSFARVQGVVSSMYLLHFDSKSIISIIASFTFNSFIFLVTIFGNLLIEFIKSSSIFSGLLFG